MKENIFLIDQQKIFFTSFSIFIRILENNYIFLDNDFLKNIFQKCYIFRKTNEA